MGKIAKLISTVAVVSATSAFSMFAWSAAGGSEAVQAASQAMQGHHRGHEGGGMMIPLEGRRLDHLLNEVKATDAQRTQIKALAQAAQADLKPLHEQARALHQQTLALFVQPQVDAAAAEALRQQALASHDAMSKRVLQIALDVSKVLTPEQRAALVAKLQKHHEHMGHRRGVEHAQLEH
jgi:protein CpxP